MIDRKKVIEGLELCTAEIPPDSSMHQYDFCIKCPYHDPVFIYCFNKNVLMKDALKVIKDQEPKLVDNIQIRTLDTVGDCPSCGIGVSKRYHPMHCGLCGQAVKWDE